jgi:hypothetical protein
MLRTSMTHVGCRPWIGNGRDAAGGDHHLVSTSVGLRQRCRVLKPRDLMENVEDERSRLAC